MPELIPNNNLVLSTFWNYNISNASHSLYLKNRQIFTWNDIKFMFNDKFVALYNLPMVSAVTDVNLAELPMEFILIELINPADIEMMNYFKMALTNAV